MLKAIYENNVIIKYIKKIKYDYAVCPWQTRWKLGGKSISALFLPAKIIKTEWKKIVQI